MDQNQNPESSLSAELKGGGGKEIGDPGKEVTYYHRLSLTIRKGEIPGSQSPVQDFE